MIETERLILRPWCEEDRSAFHAMCSDPEVMAFIGAPQSRAESDAAIDRMIACQAEHGHCFWAVERRGDGALLGFCGLLPPRPPLEHIEIGWRLGRAFWGRSYAREAAAAEKSAARKAAIAQAKAEKHAANNKPKPTEAELKAARDARYAARKARKK